MLRRSSLGVQQNTSAVYPTNRNALALRARRHTAQLNLSVHPAAFTFRVLGRKKHSPQTTSVVVSCHGPILVMCCPWKPLITGFPHLIPGSLLWGSFRGAVGDTTWAQTVGAPAHSSHVYPDSGFGGSGWFLIYPLQEPGVRSPNHQCKPPIGG